LGSLGFYYKALEDHKVVNEASKILQKFISHFVINGTVTDQCETASHKCQENQVPPKGTAVRGLGFYAALTTNMTDSILIRSILRTSMQGMVNTCNDMAMCKSVWSETILNPHDSTMNFHNQETAFELLQAFMNSLEGSKLRRLG
jgi:hypothetical protein